MLLSLTRRLGSGNRLGVAVARGRASGDRRRRQRVDTLTARRESAMPPQDCGTSVSAQ